MTLVAVELRRFLLRRAFRMLAVAVLVGLTLAGVLTFANSRPLDESALERAAQIRQEQLDACLRYVPPEIPPESRRQECEHNAGRVQDYVEDRRFKLIDLRNTFEGSAGMLAIIGVLLGASFIGAEWQHRTLTTTLTWEPRRTRLLLSKIGACAIAVLAGVAVYYLSLTLALLPSALLHGTTEGADGVWLRGLLGAGGRAAALAAGAAAVGVSLGTVARNSAAAMGVTFLYVSAFETLIRGLRPRWAPYLLGDNAAVVVTGRPNEYHFSPQGFELEGFGRMTASAADTLLRTPVQASVIVAAYVVVIVAIALRWFRNRELA